MTNRSDTFNRADSVATLGNPSDGGSAWTYLQSDTWSLSSNAAGCFGGESYALLEASSPSVEVEIVFSVRGGSDGHYGIVARYVDQNNYIQLNLYTSDGAFTLRKRVAGAFTSLGSYTATIANGDTFKLVLDGDSLSGYFNGTLRIGPVTESAFNTATKHGMWGYADSTFRADSITITDLSPSSAGAARNYYSQLSS